MPQTKRELKATLGSERIHATTVWGVLDLGAGLESKAFRVLMLLEARSYDLGKTRWLIWDQGESRFGAGPDVYAIRGEYPL